MSHGGHGLDFVVRWAPCAKHRPVVAQGPRSASTIALSATVDSDQTGPTASNQLDLTVNDPAIAVSATTVPNLGRATFTVQAQNDGTGTEDLRVRGAGSTSRYTVTYKRGTANVTTTVVNGTFRFEDVPAGGSQNPTVIMQARAGAPRNAALTRLVTVSSAAQPTVKDVVKATVTRR